MLVDEETLKKQFSEFDIDNAHCYDPNEEIKLRYILMEVVQEKKKLEQIIKDILQEKLKIYLNSRESRRIEDNGEDDDDIEEGKESKRIDDDDRSVSAVDTVSRRQSRMTALDRESITTLDRESYKRRMASLLDLNM